MAIGYDILSVAAAITLIALLVAKELLTTSQSDRALGRFLNVAIIPLLTVFAAIVIEKVIEIN